MEAQPFSGGKNPAQPQPLWKRLVRTTVATLLVAFVVATVLLMIFENKLIYFPEKGGIGPSPGEDVWLTAADGVKIHGWYLPHPEARATVLHLHGNAGNLEDRRDLVREIRGLRVNVLAIDYRGYGKSDGSPDEPGVYADAKAAYDWLLTKTRAEKIVIHGESLGGGPACELASTQTVGGLVLQSTFTRIPDMASRVLPAFPFAKWIVRTKYDNLGKIPRIGCPKLFIHSRRDEMIPFGMAEELYAAAGDPKECQWFASAGHNTLTITYPKAYYSRLEKFLEPFAR